MLLDAAMFKKRFSLGVPACLVCSKSLALAASITRAPVLVRTQRLGIIMPTCMFFFTTTLSEITEWQSRLFIDQPVGTGFSYGSTTVGTSQQAASDIWKFLQIWFHDSRFSKYASREFGIWTESYGGHYGPTFAAFVPRYDLCSYRLLTICTADISWSRMLRSGVVRLLVYISS